MKILELVEIKTKKTPIMLEVQVPPKCNPILVGNPKGNGNLRWVQNNKNNKVITWGIKDLSIESILEEMISKLEIKHEWDLVRRDFQSAQKRMEKLGIDEVHQVGNIVIPKDPTLLGSVVKVQDTYFPVLHNLKRGITLLRT